MVYHRILNIVPCAIWYLLLLEQVNRLPVSIPYRCISYVWKILPLPQSAFQIVLYYLTFTMYLKFPLLILE